jgi:hypothetical protein
MLLWGQPLMKLFVLIVSPSVSFLFEITIIRHLETYGCEFLREGGNQQTLDSQQLTQKS